MAVFITGDTHGDFRRFEKDIFYEQAELTKEDCVMVAGDFGGIRDGGAEEQRQLDWLDRKPFTTLFVSGNHENFDLLAEYPVEEWHGAQVQKIRPSVIHLMRGQIYDIQGKTFFTMGGASSHDISGGILEPDDPLFKKKCRRLDASGALYRVNHRSWWKEELPSEEEYQTARASPDRHGWQVDYIISHCCPTSVQTEEPSWSGTIRIMALLVSIQFHTTMKFTGHMAFQTQVVLSIIRMVNPSLKHMEVARTCLK